MKTTDLLLQKFADLLTSLYPQKKPSREMAKSCKIVAHRGAWSNQYLENTIPAFQRCLDAGVWAIEFDVRWTKDNVPIIHHDENTKRVFNKNIVITDTTFKVLRESIPQIPTLEEVVSLFSNKLHLMIEIKTSTTKEQELLLQKTLSPIKPIDDYHFMALNISLFDHLSTFEPKTFLAIGRGDMKSVYKKSLTKELGGITGHYLLITPKMILEQKNQGRMVGVGFPTSQNCLFRSIHQEVPWIFTNKALKLQKILNDLMN